MRDSVVAGAALLLAACGSGGGDAGGGGTGGGGDPGGGGNPLPVSPILNVTNNHSLARTETVRASVPFSLGQHTTTAGLGISNHATAWRVLQRWPDGSIRVAQAQFTDTVPGQTSQTYEVVQGVSPLTGDFVPNEWIAQLGGDLRFGGQVEDRFGVKYRAIVSGTEVLDGETPLSRVRRARLYHMPVGGAVGIGRDFLTSTLYLHEFRDMPIVVVDWILGNDYLGSDDAGPSAAPNLRPLGAVAVKDARFLVKGMAECRPYKAAWHNIGAAEPNSGFTSFPVMSDTYIDDGQTRRYRFVVRVEHPSADPAVKQKWRDTARAMAEEPMFGLAELDNWQDSLALGLLGGPLDGPADAFDRCQAEYTKWVADAEFGTWATYGDVQVTATTGTPRNHPLSPELAHAVQGNHSQLLVKLQHKAWAQAMRPYHFWQLEVTTGDGLLLWDCPPMYPGSRDLSDESLGRRAIVNNNPYAAYRVGVPAGNPAHGWQPYDHEHWSCDALFDYWTITGDPWAQEELRNLGQCLKALMVLDTFATANLQAARAEGWTMQGFVQCYLATGDASLKTFALRRVAEIVDAERMKNHPSRALNFQGNYPGTGFGPSHKFFMPWQHGALLYGYLGAAFFFESELCMQICEDVPRCIDYSWVRNFTNDPRFGTVADGLRYYVPVEVDGSPVPPNHFDQVSGVGVKWGDSPLGGAHTFLTGGLLLLARDTRDPTVRAMALEYGEKLFGGFTAYYDNKRWNKWHLVVPE